VSSDNDTAEAAGPAPVPTEDIPGVTRRHRFSDLYHERTNFQFIKHSKRWLILSTTLIVLSVGLLAFRGLNLGIDFEGGAAWQVQMQEGKHADIGEVRDRLEEMGFDDTKVSTLSGQGGQSLRVQARVVDDPVQTITDSLAAYGKVSDADVTVEREGEGATFTFTADEDVKPTEEAVQKAVAAAGVDDAEVAITGDDVTVTIKTLPADPVQAVAEMLAKYAGTDVEAVSISTVGPTWGREVSRNALKALIIFFLLLAVYLSFRFEWKMAVASIVAVIHDIIFTVGAYALFQFEVTPATVTAFLTILGFSLYDTVVVFDKITENQKTLAATGRSTYGEMVNRSLNQVLMRSLSTSVVALLPVISLLVVGSGIMGATALEDFALALAAGLFIGSYSSIFVAAPLLAWWKEHEPQYRAIAERRRKAGAAEVYAHAAAAPVATATAAGHDGERQPVGVAAAPAGPRPIQPRPRQQRRRKRK
jgi:preprotein translocase subunit SecF